MRLKRMFNRTLIGLLVFTMFGCTGSAPAQTTNQVSSGSAGMDLDAAIREAAGQMEARLPAKTTLALVSVASPSTAFSEQVITRLESAIVGSGKLGVVDRANLDKIRSEQGFQLSGEVDDDSAKAIGKLLGAGAIVTGFLTDLGDVYSLTLKAINIETAMVAVSYLADLAKSTRIETLLATRDGAGSGRTALSQAGTTGSGTTAQPPAAPVPATEVDPNRVYKIGDRGPAGGIVFYDKGRETDGWRYLEAAPRESELTAQWQSEKRSINGTYTGLGTGKQNTQRILNFMRESGELGMAAQLCNDMFIGGFDGWFLPSQGELDLMYKNLKVKGLGGFGSGWYWSSSENNSNNVWRQRFSDGGFDGSWDLEYRSNRRERCSVRAVRAF